MSTAYRIPKWTETHTNAEAARRDRLDWIKCPARFDSLGLKTLLSMSGGVEAFGVYVLLAEAAAMAPKALRDGRIVNDQGPLSIQQIALKINVPIVKLRKALRLLMSPEVAWVDEVPWPPGAAAPEAAPAGPAPAALAPEAGRAAADPRTEAMYALQRALGRATTTSDDAALQRYASSLDGTPIVIHGEQVDRWALIARALVAAAEHADCQTARGALSYVRSIVERCIQHACWPGEFPARERAGPDPDERARQQAAELAKASSRGR